jgi:hypothetical protein
LKQGESLSFVEESQPGDLAFFENPEERLSTSELCWITRELFMLPEK